MKSKVLLGILVLAVTAFSVQAQPQGGGRGPGFGRGPGGNVGETVADILVLNNEDAAKVIEKMGAVQEELMEEMRANFQGGGGGGGDMRERFQEMREKQNEKYVATLKELLSEDEAKIVEPFLGGFGRREYAPVRALRQIDLKDEQRSEFRTSTVALYEKINEIRPAFGGRGQGQGGERPNFEEMQAKTDEAVDEFSTSVSAKLSADQKTAWETKTAEIEKEMEEQRQQRRQRGGFGGGQGGRRGGNN